MACPLNHHHVTTFLGQNMIGAICNKLNWQDWLNNGFAESQYTQTTSLCFYKFLNIKEHFANIFAGI